MTYTIQADITVTELEDELVLLDPHTSAMFTLNAVGKTVWLHLKEGQASLETLVQAVAKEFEVPTDVAHKDIKRLLDELQAAKLMTAN